MEDPVSEVLYETVHHITRPFSTNYPPQRVDAGVKRGLSSFLSFPGVNQLKLKWDEYRYPKFLKKWTSLFLSPRGEHVAVASGNQITFLHKRETYKEISGVFTCENRHAIFTHGAWSESHDVLGVVDDAHTLYFLKANGEEIKRITKSALKVSVPIVGLMVQGDPDGKASYLCNFILLTSDGTLHHIEVGQKTQSRVSSMLTPNNHLAPKKQFYRSVLGVDYHPEFSLLSVIGVTSNIPGGNADIYCLSLWRIKNNIDLELVSCCPQLEGLYSNAKGHEDPLTTPKVVISPQSKRVAVLDSSGSLGIFDLDKESSTLSITDLSGDYLSQTDDLSNGKRKCLNGITDFTWWSDYILIIAKMSGVVTMIDIITGKKLLEDDSRFCLPVLERVHQCRGCVLLLESTRSEKEHSHASSLHGKDINSQDEMLSIRDKFHQFDYNHLSWSLFSFLEKSVEEMYSILIANQQYQDALDFAHRHGLDKDEVLKSQWLRSAQEADAVNLFLSNIKDQAFVLSECVDKVGPTEEAVKSLLSYGLKITDKYRTLASDGCESSKVWDFRTCRLQLLQYKDRLETFIGINMGRFALQEYCKFRTVPLHEAAVRLAESGKIGALNLLFKRHPYSLAPFMLNVLAAIPETVSVQTYGQLLPGRSPPAIISLRERDWVECEETVKFINKLPNDQISSKCIRTEWIIKESSGFFWPSVEELAIWYKSRVRDIENYSGQLDNCLCMLEFALQKGIVELRPFYESISHLYYLIYSDDSDGGGNFTMNLNDWEQVSAYEKFKMLLDKVKGDKIVERLRARAIPFMLDSASADGMTDSQCQMDQKHTESFLVRWLKEIASDNNLDICLVVIEEGCRDSRFDGIFRDEIETVECALQCIYLCTLVDRWNTMASILSKLPQIKDTDTSIESLEKRVKAAKGHVEAGRLLAYYQVPKPMSFFLEAHSDEKPVKQILRLVLSKFGRRHPGRSDIDWANMWRDMQLLQEKAFPFLDLEYMLIEFSKGLLKAGKFALARNYLKGTATVALPAEKAENLVIQAAREYFFSASSLACAEIWKAKECLNLFPHSNNVKVEADIIDVLTVKLPNLGITLLPMQFRQIRDPMEIINMVITSHSGTYLNVDELIDIGRVLGLRSQDDIAAVREVVAREAAVSGDLQLAFEQCLILAKTGHGSIWDLCAALARGPVLDNVDTSSRKQLLSFSLSHCDEESIGELLLAWKDLDMQSQCENLMMLTGTNPPNFSVQGSSIISLPGQNVQDIVRATESSNTAEGASKDDFELHVANIMKKLSTVAKAPSAGKQNAWENLLRDNGKVLTYAALTLPWLLELGEKEEFGKTKSPILQRKCGELYTSVRTQAVVTILSWLARNDIAPSDDVVASLAKSVMQVPASEEEDILGCSILLNLGDAFHGVGVIEEQLKARDVYHEVCSIMNIGMVYSSLHNSSVECGSPTKRRKLLLQKFQEKTTPFSSDVMDKMDKMQSTFWREWKTKLEEQKLLTEQSRELEQIIPGVETTRFLAGDSMYIENVVFSVIESVKQLKKPSLKEVLKLADTYNLNRTKVLLRYLASCLASEVWENNDIIAEISGSEEELMASAAEVINTISSDVYPAIDGCNKQRLAYVYGILSKCFLHLKGIEVTSLVMHTDMQYTHSLEMPQFYKTLDQECSKLSFIRNLNFKRIAGLGGLNIESFNDEVYNHIDEFSVEALADMVKTLVGIYADPVANGLISWQSVYKYYILRSLSSVVSGIREIAESVDPDNFKKVISELEQSYDCIKMYIRCLSRQDMLDIVKQYYTSSLPPNIHTGRLPDELEWMDCLIYLLKFWIIVTNDVEQVIPCDSPEEKLIKFNLESLSHCLRVLIHLVEEEKISTNQCWGTISDYVHHGLSSFTADVYNICRAMVVSGCQFEAINQVYSGAVARSPESQFSIIEGNLDILETLGHLYVNIVDSFMLEMTDESNNRWILHNLLSSLCKAEGNLENLRNIRCAVWGRLTELAHNMQLKSQVRVYTLELMQSITGRNLKGRSNHLLDIEPWECWDEPDCTVTGSDSINQSVSADGSSRFTSTLVALKSTRLASALSSSIEITPDDLANIDTAVSCFLTLSEAANTQTHFKALQDILEEWAGLFSIERQEDPDEAVDAENDWGEDWDEGWESFQEEKPLENKGKDYNSMSIHPLHVCWMQILRKLIALAQFRDVFQLIDGSLVKPNVTLLDADEIQSLIQLVVETDSFTALKLALLLPYEAIHLQCLDSFEAVLKQGVSNTIEDRQLFTLLLSSGAMSTIATNSAYGTTFSYICYMAGHFSRLCQESQLSQKGEGTDGIRTIDEKFFILFRAILFPCFISELVKVKQPLLAGIMVSRFMHTHSSLNLVNVAEASLRRYLEGQVQMQKDPDISFKKIGSCIYLEYTVSSLRGRLDTLMQFALSLLSDNGK